VALIWNSRLRDPAGQTFVLERNTPVPERFTSNWLSSNDLLIVRHADSPLINDLPGKVASIRHLRTGRSEPVPELYKILTAAPYDDATVRLSPSRKSIRVWSRGEFHFIRLDGKSGEISPFQSSSSISDAAHSDSLIMAIDATSYPNASLKNKPTAGVAFYPDDPNHWMTCGSTSEPSTIPYVVGNDAGATSEVRFFNIPKEDIIQSDRIRRLGQTPDGNTLFYFKPVTDIMGTTTPSVLLEYRIGLADPVHKYLVALPIPKIKSKGTVYPDFSGLDLSVVLSPDGKRIAWILPYPQEASNLQLMSFLRRNHILSPLPDRALWVSDRYGRNMRRLASWDTQASNADNLDWTPDGRDVTFLHTDYISSKTTNTTICKIPAPP